MEQYFSFLAAHYSLRHKLSGLDPVLLPCHSHLQIFFYCHTEHFP